jgi:hypothetical protein
MNKYLWCVLAFLCLLAPASFAATGYVFVTGQNLKDNTGTLITNATITWAPVFTNASPMSVRIGGASSSGGAGTGIVGGQSSTTPVSAQVTNGAFSITVLDTSLTNPQNLCYNVTITDNVSGNQLLGPGYGCVQPGTGNTNSQIPWCASGGMVCDFDQYLPSLASQLQTLTGPVGLTGPQGPQGIQGIPGTVTATGTSGAFTVPGLLTASQSEIQGGTLGQCLTTTGSSTPNQWSGACAMDVTQFGAHCDWNGTTGTDDTSHVQAAVTAANTYYTATGIPRTVSITGSCVVNGVVTIGSGVHIQGPGQIVVNVSTQPGATLDFVNADQAEVNDLTINVPCCSGYTNNAADAAIGWYSTTADTATHVHFAVHQCQIIGYSSWGILVDYNWGTGSITDVDIGDNTISTPAEINDADAIHIAGRVIGARIHNNFVYNRGDAAYAATANVLGSVDYVPMYLVFDGNVSFNSAICLDDSGAPNTIWSNNYCYMNEVPPDHTPGTPQARAIAEPGSTGNDGQPFNVRFIGNTIVSTNGGAFPAMQITEDCCGTPSNLNLSIQIQDNLIGSDGLYITGNGVVVQGNTFKPGATLTIAPDPSTSPIVNAANIAIGKNFWLGSATIAANGNAAYYANNMLDQQQASSGLTLTESSPLNLIPQYPQIYTFTSTASTTDVVGTAIPSTGHCNGLSPMNASAVGAVGATYFFGMSSGNVTIAHPTTAGMQFSFTCYPY